MRTNYNESRFQHWANHDARVALQNKSWKSMLPADLVANSPFSNRVEERINAKIKYFQNSEGITEAEKRIYAAQFRTVVQKMLHKDSYKTALTTTSAAKSTNSTIKMYATASSTPVRIFGTQQQKRLAELPRTHLFSISTDC